MYLIAYEKFTGLFWASYIHKVDAKEEALEFIEQTEIRRVKLYKATEIKLKITIEDVDNE